MGPHALVAVTTEDPLRFASEAERAWADDNAVLPIDPRLAKPEVDDILRRMRPAAIISGDVTAHLNDSVEVHPTVALVLGTSGTTGAAKGVEISMDALRASIGATASHLGSGPEDRWLVCLPVAHVAGLKTLFASTFGAGLPRIIRGFDIEAIASEKAATLVSLVPTQMTRLLDAGVDLSRYRAVLLGGGPIPQDLVGRAVELGINVVRTYGMTETCGGCIYDGIPLPIAQMRIGDAGVIELRGEMLFEGYRLDPDLTEASMRDGWFVTRDIGSSTPDGELVVHGRFDDMIVTGGQNVSPVEVESVIAEHPGVIDCAVVGLPDDRWGQRVVALVATRPHVTDEDIRDHCRTRLASYKVPKQVLRVASIPRSSTGKIIRSQLRVIAATLLGK